MKRLLIRLLSVALALAFIAVYLAWRILDGSLPVLDGERVADGLDASVTIERDAAGIPTLRARNRRDLAFATGFAHGQDRLFQMDLMRRKAAGELAALAGPRAVPFDKRHRLHRFRTRAREALDALPAADAELLNAYASGVNASREGLSSRPFEYVVLRASPEPWRPEDSLLVLYAMFFELNDERADRDTRRGFAHRVLPRDVFDWLYPDGTRWDAPLDGEPRAPGPIPGPESYDLRDVAIARGTTFDDEPLLLPGSNNWAVGGALTADGRAIVANDMHLGLTVPNTFYRARLVVDAGDALDVSGVTLPGMPAVVAGSNGHIAWGFTNSYGDWSDAVVVRPGLGRGTYRSPEGERRFREYREVIEVRGADAEELLVRETIWGPVRDDLDFAGAELAISWIAHDAQAVNLGQIGLESVRTVDEALAVANRSGIPPQNFVCGDAGGNIGWTIAGRIPRRADYDSRQPADWSEQTGWTGWLAPDDYPRIVNPPDSRLWTANSRVTDGAALAAIGDGGYQLGARAQQIRGGLRSRERFRPADMLAIQLDDRALFLQRWRDLLLVLLDSEAQNEKPMRAEYRRLVEEWIPRAATASVGYRLVRAFHDDLRHRVFDMLMTPVRAAYDEDVPLRMSTQFEGPLWMLVTERPEHLLTSGVRSWRDLLLLSVDETLAELAAGDVPLREQSWGLRNTAAIRHPLSEGLPAFARWLDMPRDPLPGDWNMPRVQGPSFGASERFALSPGDEANGYLHMPAGQSGHPLSDFYRRGHGDWAAGKPSPFLPGRAQHRLTLSPPR